LPGSVGFTEALERPSGKLKPGPGRPAAEVADHQQARICAALLEVVAERGYAGLTVREIAGRARVSTRSFYQHYPNKDACFLGVHQLVVRRVLGAIEAEAALATSGPDRLGPVVAAIVRELAADPQAARLMLIDAYAAGLPALKQARLAGRSIEARIGECLGDAPADAGLAPLAAEGIVAGVFAAARSRLLDGGDLVGLCDPLARWAGAYHELSPRQIEEAELARRASTSNGGTDPSDGEGMAAPEGDRGLLLTATARLVASRGSARLGLEDIVSTAGISRRGFEAEFADLEACVAAAHRLYADRAVDQLLRNGEELEPGEAGSSLALLGPQLAADSTLAALCFSDVAVSGPRLARSHQQFIAQLACLAAGTTEAPVTAAEASAGALWGLLRQRVVMGRAAQAPEAATALTSLALLPLQVKASRLSAP